MLSSKNQEKVLGTKAAPKCSGSQQNDKSVTSNSETYSTHPLHWYGKLGMLWGELNENSHSGCVVELINILKPLQ